MPIVGIADTGCDPRFLPPMNDLARGIWSTGDSVACSHADRERGWYAGLSSALTKLGFNGEMRLTPDVVKRAVQVMARPMEGCESWEAGAGELGPDEIRDYLCDLTPSKVLDIFCPDLVRNALPETLRSIDASQGGLWPREKVDALAQLFLGGIRCATVKVL